MQFTVGGIKGFTNQDITQIFVNTLKKVQVR